MNSLNSNPKNSMFYAAAQSKISFQIEISSNPIRIQLTISIDNYLTQIIQY